MLIELKDVNKTYQGAQPLHVLKGIDLTIEKGEFVSIMGASGSGKSTLLNILGILDNYDSGEYRINGNLIWNLSETKAAEYRNRDDRIHIPVLQSDRVQDGGGECRAAALLSRCRQAEAAQDGDGISGKTWIEGVG